jgi:hypothetical protein
MPDRSRTLSSTSTSEGGPMTGPLFDRLKAAPRCVACDTPLGPDAEPASLCGMCLMDGVDAAATAARRVDPREWARRNPCVCWDMCECEAGR